MNTRDSDKYNDDEVTAKQLFKAGISLYEVSSLRNASITKLMIGYGSNVNFRHPFNGFTALHKAVELSCPENVKVLIEHGADVNIKSYSNFTPLCAYGFYGFMGINDRDDLEILKLLLASGASLYERDNQGNMPITYLLTNNRNIETVRILLQYNMDLNVQDIRGGTVIHTMISSGVLNFTNELKDRQFDIDLANNEGETTLSYAVLFQHLEAMEFLLGRGANVNSRCSAGITPLFHAFTDGKRDQALLIIETLLLYGADTQHMTNSGRTVFDFALLTKNLPLLKPIVAHLVMLKNLGTSINPILWIQISKCLKTGKQIASCERLLEIMKRSCVYESVTLWKLLTETDRKIIRYCRNPFIALRLIRLNKKCRFRTYYFKLLRNRINKALQSAELQQRAALVVSRITMLSDVTVEKIIDNLNEDSLQQLCAL